MPHEADALHVITVLPPSERFAAGEAGAIALLARRMATQTETIIGQPPLGAAFPGIHFVPVTPAFRPYSLTRRYAVAVARAVKKLKPDLLEVHNRPDLALLLRKLCPSVPVMLLLHNDPCFMRCARTTEERTKLARTLQVVAVSEWIRNRFLSENVTASVSILPNSIAIADMPPRSPVRDKLILFAGRVVADKGVDTFVAACRDTLLIRPDWRAEIIGADRFGPDSPETPFIARLRPQAKAGGVSLPGYKPHDEVLTAMARAAIVVVPSRWAEPFGMAALEAMASGAALIVSDRGSLPAVVGEAGLYCNPDDVSSLTQCLLRLTDDARLRQSMGEAALKRARTFDVTAIKQQRAKLHQSILHSQ